MEKSLLDDIIARMRKEFFALRNGMIADTLRKGGLDQKYIFGLQLPQIKEIWQRFHSDDESEDAEMACTLWQDRECREARLLACHLMPPSMLSEEEALSMAKDVRTREEADILAFRLLKRLPFALSLAEKLKQSDDPLHRYAASAIERFFI